MAVQKQIKTIQENLSLTVETQKYISYTDYFNRLPLFTTFQLQNKGGEVISNLLIVIKDENGLLVETKKEIEEIPFESTVEISFDSLCSPLFLMENKEIQDLPISITVLKDGICVASATPSITVLPFDTWSGLNGNCEQLASFVRPKIADCNKILADATIQLKKWQIDAEFTGYVGNDKNKVRQTAAAIFSAIRRNEIEKEEVEDYSVPIALSSSGVLKEKKASALSLAIFTAACLERANLNPILFVGKEYATCGVWLYDTCCLDTVNDDLDLIDKYISAGINNVCCFDIEDLFSGKSIGFTTSEIHFSQRLKTDCFELYVDVRRCRIAHYPPLPLRLKGVNGYEVLQEEDITSDNAPKNLLQLKKLSLDGKAGKDKQWERRLLDLSLKNSLLNFDPTKYVLHLICANTENLSHCLSTKEMYLESKTEESKIPDFNGTQALSSYRELIAMENEKGILRAFSTEENLNEVLSRLVKKSKEADEESGARVLYIAFGFLKWTAKEDGMGKYAPLILQPVRLKKQKGNNGYCLAVCEEEYRINTTLLEYLKQEFNIDIRGLDGDISALKISEVLAMIKMEIVNMKGWDVTDDVYLAVFSFARYLMWNDLRHNIDEFKKNALVSSLLNNRLEISDGSLSTKEEDDADMTQTLTPLSADSSQFSAIALSQTGKSFVLHGPPGTGKSQTITNMIANALNDGKRVLFVAEKQAALSVVKKRLDSIGLGEFCLELHSNKTDKSEIVRKIQNTLSLAPIETSTAFVSDAQNAQTLRSLIREPLSSLHKKRRLGVSLYEAVLIYLKNKNAPDMMNIESSFYDGLTKENLEKYEQLLLNTSAAAKECGGVYNSPFENVNLTEYSQSIRDTVYCSSEVMLAEIKHLKSYLALFLSLYRQKISTFTRKKATCLKEMCALLLSGDMDVYFQQKEEDFYAFYNANRRLDSCLKYYYKHFKSLIDIDKEQAELSDLLEHWGGNYRVSKTLISIVKKLKKVALEEIKEDDFRKYLETVNDIYIAITAVKNNTLLSKNFLDYFGKINYKKRAEFLSDLNHLHDLGGQLFMDYNPDSFNSACIRAQCGYSKPALLGLKYCLNSFFEAESSFSNATKANRNKINDEDLNDYYIAKASALIDNIDMLAAWCQYKNTTSKLDEAGLKFVSDALENGKITGDNITSSFRKNVYKNFLETNLPIDPVLSHFSASVLEESVEQYRLTLDDFSKQSENKIRAKLISRLPKDTTEGPLSLELTAIQRALKGNLRGMGIRGLLEQTPELMKVVAPCLLMSPITVAQYLAPKRDLFDLVIFDEASQMPTAESIGSLARASSAVIVGDPRQLPPTSFFSSSYVDEENLENEDMESVLDDALALGLTQRYLTWHYRSKHESLIAFSNLMYYDGKLRTFPSPDAMDSHVKFNFVEDGVYDRGFSKNNKKEAQKLIEEVIRRLSDPVLSRSSMGIVTFSTAQREYIDRKLSQAISKNKLEDVAYDREEPLFIKNLENVQGDERDVILFSVCYGPDQRGKVSLNFGPLNQMGGWRRLNVAVSRAREEMLIYSSMTSTMIDLSKTTSKGVAGLKAFLEFAQRGRTTLAINSRDVILKEGLGKYIAAELHTYGYDCRYDVGVSEFKIDVAVMDPKNKHKFILAVLLDGTTAFSIKDRNILQVQTLKRNNWNVLRIYTVNYFNNPKREIKKIKDYLDKLTGADKRVGSVLTRSKKAYKLAQIPMSNEAVPYILSEHDGEICARLKQIVTTEEPISCEFLIKRCLSTYGIGKYGVKLEGKMNQLISMCAFKEEALLGRRYLRKTDKCISLDKYRVESGEIIRKNEEDFTPYEILSLIKSALEDRVSLYMDEIILIASNIFSISKNNEKFASFINDCVSLGEKRGLFVRSVSDRISLA